MKRIYFIVTLFFFLFTVTSCEEDFRDIVLFEGVEPIYQIGTCDNLVASATLYLTRPDGIMLGIDGGDGSYSLEGGDATVASVSFSKDVNGYRRIKVLPVGEGVTNIFVKDGSGSLTMLQIAVKDCFKFFQYVQQIGYIHTGELDEKHWNQIQADLTGVMTMKCEGGYVFMPADLESPWMGGGKLRVHSSALVSGFMEGTYELVEVDGGKAVYRLSYNGEVHDFAYEPLGFTDTKSSPISTVTVYEEVTSLVTASLPQGCRVYRMERWRYYMDDPFLME